MTRVTGGAFIVARQVFSSEIWRKPPIYLKAWTWVIGHANHAHIERGGRVYRRGEFTTTYQEVINALAYTENHKTIKPTLKQVRRVLAWLSGQGMITVIGLKSAKSGLGRAWADPGAETGAYVGIRITVCNYDIYQSLDTYTGADPGAEGLAELGQYNKNDLTKKTKKPAPEPSTDPPSAPGFDRIPDEAVRASLERVCRELVSTPGPEGKPLFGRAFEFVNRSLGDGLRPEAVLKALTQIQTIGHIRSPWPYAKQVSETESKNICEREAIARHEELKKTDPLQAFLTRGMRLV